MKGNGMNGVGPGAVDLGALRRADVPQALRVAAEEEGEVKGGLRCSGCRRRVTSGLRVHAILIAFVGGQGAIKHTAETVCTDPECGRMLELLRDENAVAVEKVGYRFLDDDATRAALGLGPLPDGPAPIAPEPGPVAA
jgi:hypothetical protein